MDLGNFLGGMWNNIWPSAASAGAGAFGSSVTGGSLGGNSMGGSMFSDITGGASPDEVFSKGWGLGDIFSGENLGNFLGIGAQGLIANYLAQGKYAEAAEALNRSEAEAALDRELQRDLLSEKLAAEAAMAQQAAMVQAAAVAQQAYGNAIDATYKGGVLQTNALQSFLSGMQGPLETKATYAPHAWRFG